MAVRRVGRKLIGCLLAVNAIVYLTVLVLAGWSLNNYIDGQKNHPHYDLRIFFLRYALAGSAIGTCSVFLGCAHLRAWNRCSLASAASLGTTSWTITMLAFGGRTQRKTIANIGDLYYDIRSEPAAVPAAS